MTTLACPDRLLATDIDGRQWGIYQVGNIYMHWLEDTSGNPLIRNPDDNQLHYADWNPETHEWDCKELFSIASRKAFLKKKYLPPSYSEQSSSISKHSAPLPKLPKGVMKVSAKQVEASSAIKPVLIRGSSEGVSGASVSSSSIKRPLLLIYVKFSDSTGADVPDSDILTLITDKETFGTVANFYQQNFKGAVELSAFNNRIYHVTLPRPGYLYYASGFGGNSGQQFMVEVTYEAIKDVVTNQGVDLLSLVASEEIEDHMSSAIGYDGLTTNSGDPIVFHEGKAIDPAVVTPVILLHGQEVAAGGLNVSGAIATEASVWGHATPNTCFIGFNKNDELVCLFNNIDEDGYVVGYDLEKGEKGLYIDGDGQFALDSIFKVRITSSAAFGLFHGTNVFSIGIMAHELGHALFYLPDLYDVQTPSRTANDADDDIMGMGVWSLMANNWTQLEGAQSGSCPPNLDGYCLHYFNQKFCTPIFSNGTQTLTDPFTPHVIIDPDNPDETFILQLRCFNGYDAGIPVHWKNNNGSFSGYTGVSTRGQTYDPDADQAQPGVLIEHVNTKLRLDRGNRQTGILNVGADSSLPYSLLLGGILEAHGGSQHLRVDVKRESDASLSSSVYGKFNDGDRKDLYGVFGHNEFGQNTDPDTSYWMSSGKAKFDITNISVDASNCTATYDIAFAQEGEDPNWNDLPNDPLRPNATSAPEEPEEPEEPAPPPVEVACARPRFWRFRDLRHAVPVGFVQHW